MKDVVLVSSPFYYGYLPSQTLSILKPLLEKNNIDCGIYYANLVLKKVSSDTYEDLCVRFKLLQYAEFLFAPFAFPEARAKHDTYLKIVKSEDEQLFKEISRLGSRIKGYLEHITEQIVLQKPALIFLDCSFKQVSASIAIANKVKTLSPSTKVIIGGYSCLGSMGDELAGLAGSVDYFMKGTNEKYILKLVQEVLSGEDSGTFSRVITCPPLSELDDMPFPDFDDYFQQRRDLNFDHAGSIPFETSRGCWWGEKSHCIFCGHEDSHLTYFHKSPERTLEELQYLIGKYNPRNILAKDAIMPSGFIKDVFAKLDLPESVQKIFYEVKPGISLEDIMVLRDNKMKLQVGLESLNNHILGLLGKGLTAAGNIQFLKNCRTAGVLIHYNFLYALPGDKEADYLDMVENILPYITHLQPPGDVRKPVIQRFSPLYEKAESFGITNLRPNRVYEYIYPDSADLSKLALYFEGDYEHAFTGNRQLEERFLSLLQQWRDLWRKSEPPQLRISRENPESLKIIDTRRGAPGKSYDITEKHIEILQRVDREKITGPLPDDEFGDLVSNEVLIVVNKRYISLITQN